MEDDGASSSTASSSRPRPRRMDSIEEANAASAVNLISAQSGHVNDSREEANPPVNVSITGPIHYVIQPAYNLIRGQEAEKQGLGTTSRAISNVDGVDIEQIQVVFTLKNSTLANSMHPERNYDHIVDISENEVKRLKRMRKLYHAAATGNWKIFNETLGQEREEVVNSAEIEEVVNSAEREEVVNSAEREFTTVNSAVLTVTGETALHIAAGANQVEFFEMLLEEPGIDLINSRDVKGNTVLCTAAAAGASKIVRQLWNAKPELFSIDNENNKSPAYIAATFGHGHIAMELYTERREREEQGLVEQNPENIRGERLMSDEDKICLFFTCIYNDVFDLALKLLNDCPSLKLECRRDLNDETALHLLARKPSAFSFERQRIWSKLVRCPFMSPSNAGVFKTQASDFLDQLLQQLSRRERNVFLDVIEYPHHLLFEATALGNYKFLAMLIQEFPDLIWARDSEGKSIFHTAILKRDMQIFALIHETGLVKNVVRAWEDQTTGDNILHLAAKLPHKDILNSVPGEALQMQKEVLLFEKLEKFVPASYKNTRNTAGKTPKQVFTLEHETLRSDGEEWIKKNAKCCLLVAILIVTVVFPAAYIVPGENNNKSNDNPKIGLAILSAINAVSMGSSMMSIALFFSLLISRYAEDDFISSLPRKFISGLLLLFVSLMTMMLSFCIETLAAFVHHDYVLSRIIIIFTQAVAIIFVLVFLICPLICPLRNRDMFQYTTKLV